MMYLFFKYILLSFFKLNEDEPGLPSAFFYGKYSFDRKKKRINWKTSAGFLSFDTLV